MKYLSGTIEIGILYQADELKGLGGGLDDYANDVYLEGQLTTGFCVLFGGSLLPWNSECRNNEAEATC